MKPSELDKLTYDQQRKLRAKCPLTKGEPPSNYVARGEWMEKMFKTHKQVRCLRCGLYHVWVPKKKKAGQ